MKLFSWATFMKKHPAVKGQIKDPSRNFQTKKLSIPKSLGHKDSKKGKIRRGVFFSTSDPFFCQITLTISLILLSKIPLKMCCINLHSPDILPIKSFIPYSAKSCTTPTQSTKQGLRFLRYLNLIMHYSVITKYKLGKPKKKCKQKILSYIH